VPKGDDDVSFDVVIRNGTVVDGSGLAPYRADVGIRDGRIASIGRIQEVGREEIDAEGHIVTPGFIDGHTHMDAQLFWDELGTNSCWHGVSTVVMGNCGFTLAPAHPDRRELVVRNLERAEDISPAALAAGVEWSWERFGGYLDAVDRAPKAINYAANIGHSALRTWAMGERAFEEEANEDDLAAMEGELRDALHAGAIGFTTSRSDQHETSDNRPVASRLASWDEVRRLVGAMGHTGAGVFQLTNEPVSAGDPDGAAEYRGRLGALALEAGVPVTFGVSANPMGRDMLRLIDDTVAGGGRMFGLSHSRGITVMLSFKTRLPFDVLPEWKEVRGLPQDAQIRALRDPDVRKKLVYAAHHGDYGRPIGAEARKPDYDVMRIFERPVPPTPTVAEVAAERGVDPVELIIDLAVESNFEQFFAQPLTRQSDEDLLALLKNPHAVMTFSDSGAHVSQILDCSIQTHLLAYWVRDRQAISLEEAIRMITLVPAMAWGFPDRGLLREGLVADVNVLDPARVAPEMPSLEYDLPGGARRLVQKASGFLATVVGGEIVLRSGTPTGARPGQLLRGPLAGV
jgi:N-acyl-D-aspartate/D-glutamate deacylase